MLSTVLIILGVAAVVIIGLLLILDKALEGLFDDLRR